MRSLSRRLLLPAALLPATLLAAAPLAAQTPTRPLPRADFILTMDGEFRKIDADKDGQLTRPEIESFQRASAIAKAQASNRALFAQLDVDRNGQVSAAEFAKLQVPTPRTDATTLLRFDSSRDGKVSLLEHRTATLANFDRLDTDKDGNVSPAEGRAGGVIK